MFLFFTVCFNFEFSIVCVGFFYWLLVSKLVSCLQMTQHFLLSGNEDFKQICGKRGLFWWVFNVKFLVKIVFIIKGGKEL